eukprot:CAMPEP_0194133388 /NCGR_PEP_ID=MMETSP0152-20130528/3586_1 /TAXON_ID=1049557 /ORGANISM="Thalassiothrix antarctica, Strain L6-D1" /LENGTH=298 /DNA_ID=CAMNT_0038828699 /DNA_START=41 /DNA_END=934 /DNA_ORIENTATION=+
MLKLIFAGLLSIPCLLLCITVAPVIAILSIPPLLLLIFRKDDNDSSSQQRSPDHVVIVGGSSGIGLSIAKECIKRGIPHIVLLARNKEKLERAKKMLLSEITTTPVKIDIFSVSVSDYPSLEKIVQKELVDIKKNKHDHRTILFNCAGIPYTAEFEKIPIEQYSNLINTNQLGTMYVVKAFLPIIENGTIVFTSSAAGQVGLYGYAAYSPTKYALRGFAEALQQELLYSRPNVRVQIAFPADTDTPGYQEESKMMPEITKKLNDSAGLANPDDTAKKMLSSATAMNPKFAVAFNFEGW